MGQAMMLRRGGSGGGAMDMVLTAISSSLLLPASAPNGTVAIVTTATIGKLWVGKTAPSSGMVAGDVYIRTTGVLSFGLPVALEERFVIYPAAVYQYASGAWAMMRAYYRIGGAWVNSAFVVYSEGDKVSGTWVGSSTGTAGRWLTDNATNFVVGCTGNNSSTTFQYATNSVALDVTEHTTMHVLCDVVHPGPSNAQYVGIGLANAGNTTFVAIKYAAVGTFSDLELTLDITALTGSYRPQVQAGVWGNESYTRSITVKRVWFTR